MTEVEVLQKSYEAVLDQKHALMNKITRLQSLLDELMPYLLTEVRLGLEIGPFEDCPEPECEDCKWYEHCLVWKARIDSGELGKVSL
jgi:hypothetical protein